MFFFVARIAVEANSYIKVVPNQILVPIIESVKVLKKDDIDEILCNCFSVFIISLMDFILEESFRFRYVFVSRHVLNRRLQVKFCLFSFHLSTFYFRFSLNFSTLNANFSYANNH